MVKKSSSKPKSTKSPVTKRHKKVLRDNISGITKPVLARLYHNAGGLRMEKVCYAELREILKTELEHIVRDSVILAQSRKAKTVKSSDVKRAVNENRGGLAMV